MSPRDTSGSADAAEEGQGARVDGEARAAGEVVVAVVGGGGGELEGPFEAEAARGQAEGDRLPCRVEEYDEGVGADGLAALGGDAGLDAVQEDAELGDV